MAFQKAGLYEIHEDEGTSSETKPWNLQYLASKTLKGI
jgi:hypothetical protein